MWVHQANYVPIGQVVLLGGEFKAYDEQVRNEVRWRTNFAVLSCIWNDQGVSCSCTKNSRDHDKEPTKIVG